jgi:inorganic triphosphatase YgiF
MATEIEIKLRLEARHVRKLLAHPLLKGMSSQKQNLLNTYYDTPELTLRQRRIALRLRKKGWEWLQTVKSAEPASGGLAIRNEWEIPATPGQFDFAHVDNAELRSLLNDTRDRLEPVFTTDFRRQAWQIACGDSLIEMALDRGRISAKERSTGICEVELELISGRVEDIFELTRQLQQHVTLHPEVASKAERGYRLFHNEPEQPFRAKPLPIHPEQTPVEAFRTIALGCLEHFQRNEAGLLAGGEPEFIHQARVALRRLRSAIKLFAPVLPENFVAAYGQSWQTLAGALGEARNWDVFLEETLPPIIRAFPHSHDVHRLHSEAKRRVKAARRAITSLLRLKEYPRLMVEFTAAVHALSDTVDTPLKRFASERIAVHTRSVRKLAERYDELDDAQRHIMRLRFKKLRYALEFMTPLLPSRQMKRYLETLSRLQEALGLINDQVTARLLIDEATSDKRGTVAQAWVAGRQEILVAHVPEMLEAWLKNSGQRLYE